MFKSISYRGYDINILNDDEPENPRDWDNVGIMICFHRRYKLGDETTVTSNDFDNWKELFQYIDTELHGIVILPLYLYDHSGLSMSCGTFRHVDPQGWDSGQVGFIFTTSEKLTEYGIDLDKAEEILRSEVKTYDSYLRGNVYGYEIYKKRSFIDSCFGYYNDDAVTEAKSIIDYRVETSTKKHISKLKKLIKNKVPIIYRKSLQL